jgi:hypothetical protein
MCRVLFPQHPNRAWQFGFIALACSLISACGGKQEEDFQLVPVTGKVSVGGVSLPRGQVVFYPDESKGNKSNKMSSGLIKSDGTFTLSTTQNGSLKEGAPPGWYKVTVTGSGMSDPEQAKTKMPTFNPADSNQKTTKLHVEVKQGGGPYDLKLTKLQ